MNASSLPEEIVEAAARIVAAEGPDALTLERLAKETGLSRATLYRRSGGRGPLLDALAAAGEDVGDRSDTRAKILAGAREVFGRAGFDAATIEQVASAAGVGVASVYRWFGDKDGLVGAFLDELAPGRAARETRARATGDLKNDLVTFAVSVLAGMQEDAPMIRLVLLEALKGGPLLPRVRAMSPVRSRTVLTALLREHAAAGRLRGEPKELAQAFAGMVLAFGVVAPLLHGEPAADPEETARTITDLFLHGALAERTP